MKDISVFSEYGKGSRFSFRLPQEIVDPSPLASVADPGSRNVLLLNRGIRGECNKRMLDSLGVPFRLCEHTSEALQAQPPVTHFLYHDNIGDESMRMFKEHFPGCRFIAVRDMRRALEPSANTDTTLFEPLLVIELTQPLGKTAGSADPAKAASEATDGFTLYDARALIVDDNNINLMVGASFCAPTAWK